MKLVYENDARRKTYTKEVIKVMEITSRGTGRVRCADMKFYTVLNDGRVEVAGNCSRYRTVGYGHIEA
jgi:hypothetical protein